VAQNKKKNPSGTTTTAPASVSKQEPSTAGQAKARRIANQKAAELRNKELRAKGEKTPWELAKAARFESRSGKRAKWNASQKKAAAKRDDDRNGKPTQALLAAKRSAEPLVKE